MRKGGRIIVLVLLAGALSLAGCTSGLSSKFKNNGLPASRYLVGGGFSIEYVAPAVGTACWVEENTEKILETKSVVTGDKVEFGPVSMDSEEVKKVLGIELAEARFTLYFIPN